MTQNINLLELPRKEDTAAQAAVRHAAIAASMLVAVAATFAALQWKMLDNARNELRQVQNQTELLRREQDALARPDPVATERLAREEREVADLEVIADQFHRESVGRIQGFTEALRAFGRATAPGVWLTALKIDNTTGSMTIEGRAIDASRLPALVNALQSEPHFSGTRFASMELRPGDAPVPDAAPSMPFRITTPVSDGSPPGPAPASAMTAAIAASGHP